MKSDFKLLIENDLNYLQTCIDGHTPYFGIGIRSIASSISYAKFAKTIVKQYSQKHKKSFLNILEIGSFGGLSAISLVEGVLEYHDAGGHITCVDPFEVKVNSIKENKIFDKTGRDVSTYSQFDIFWYNIMTSNSSKHVTPLKMKSCDALTMFKKESFDIILVDGAHDYENVYKDLSFARKLLKDGGIICGDDTFISKITKENYEENAYPGVTKALFSHFGETSCQPPCWAIKKTGNEFNSISFDFNEEKLDVEKYITPEINTVFKYISICSEIIKSINYIENIFKEHKSIALYGAGLNLKQLTQVLTEEELSKIVCVIDDFPQQKAIQTFPLISVEYINKYNLDAVLITSTNYMKKMYSNALKWNLDCPVYKYY